MRLGMVRVLHEYAVDLDDPEMVKRARAFLKSDLAQMARYPDRDADLDKAIGTAEVGSSSSLTEEDIEDCTDEVESRQFSFASDPVEYIREDGSYSVCGEDFWLDPGDHMVTTDDAIDMERMTLLRDSIAAIKERQDEEAKVHDQPSAETNQEAQG